MNKINYFYSMFINNKCANYTLTIKCVPAYSKLYI